MSQERSTYGVSGINGFTLIELLISIVIVGVLASIALPSILKQVSRARSSEAKSNHGAIIRAQKLYRIEQGRFANDLSVLDTKVRDTKNFSYSVSESSDMHAIHASTREGEDLLDYASGIVIQPSTEFNIVICEGLAPGTKTSGGGFASVNYDSAALTVDCSQGRPVD